MRRFLLISVLALCAVTASADVTLLAPRAGDRLEGGSDAIIKWSADAVHAEEWEAFLSVDGGKTYAVRITPHLDLRTRSFRFRVPNVTASNVRILIRVGDERDEQRIELPQTFSIAATTKLDFNVVESKPVGNDGAVEWVTNDLVRHRTHQTSASHAPSLNAVTTFDLTGEEVLSPESCVLSETETRTQDSGLRTQDSAFARPILLLCTRMNC